jgi:hypothetical protein
MRNTRERSLYKLAFEREAQSVQQNFRNMGRVNNAIPPNIGGTNLELSVDDFCLQANACNLSVGSSDAAHSERLSAKNVMQVHWTDPDSGQIGNKRALKKRYFSNTCQSFSLSGPHGILWWVPALGSAVDRNGPSGGADAREVRQYQRTAQLITETGKR